MGIHLRRRFNQIRRHLFLIFLQDSNMFLSEKVLSKCVSTWTTKHLEKSQVVQQQEPTSTSTKEELLPDVILNSTRSPQAYRPSLALLEWHQGTLLTYWQLTISVAMTANRTASKSCAEKRMPTHGVTWIDFGGEVEGLEDTFRNVFTQRSWIKRLTNPHQRTDSTW